MAYYKFENPETRLTSRDLKGFAATIFVDKEKMNGSHVYFFHQTKVGQLIKGRFCNDWMFVDNTINHEATAWFQKKESSVSQIKFDYKLMEQFVIV